MFMERMLFSYPNSHTLSRYSHFIETFIQKKILERMNLEDLSLTFTVGTGGKSERLGEVELIPNGSQVAVTNSNYLEYIYRVAHFKLNTETSRQSRYVR